tara:strand:+ start:9329 stop:9922 length:594 start_codon:yes stop_codon:yes gene_type:complete
MENVYKNLSAISVADKVEKKGAYPYLSWAWAWHYVKQEYPTANRIVYENEMGMPYFTDGKFANVKVGIVINGIEHIDYLPILDNANRPIPLTKLNSFNVNNSVQRATAKAIAMHGLGLSLWIGEDTGRLNEVKEVKDKPVQKEQTFELTTDKWDKVLMYVAKNKDKGLDYIVAQLSTKYKVTPAIKTKLKKAINGKK